ncbi:MAG: hypothetical protein V7K72_03990 [Nostoc sp.]
MSTTGCPVSPLYPSPNFLTQQPITSNHVCWLLSEEAQSRGCLGLPKNSQ